MTSATQSVEALCEQARERLQKRDVQGALALYEQAIALNPDHIPAHEGLATVCFAAKDYERAVELFKRLIALDPRRIDALVNLGAVYNRMGDYQQAIKMLRQALTRDRRCAEAYYNLGLAQRGAQQLSMAVSAYKEAIRLAPDMAEAYSNLGNVLMEMGNFTQATLNFERALQLRPDFPKAKQGLIKARNRADEAKRAISPFGRLVDIKEVEKRSVAGDRKLRSLTPQERFEDRNDVHRLAKEGEQCSVAVCDQLKVELSPAVLELTRVVTETENPRAWIQEAEAFTQAIEHFKRAAELANQKWNELHSHEQSIRSRLEKS